MRKSWLSIRAVLQADARWVLAEVVAKQVTKSGACQDK